MLGHAGQGLGFRGSGLWVLVLGRLKVKSKLEISGCSLGTPAFEA